MQRVLPADVYDVLELSAWVHGGIGAMNFDDYDGAPLCAYGHCRFAENGLWSGRETWNALASAGIFSSSNDEAVRAINERHGAPCNARVPFEQWCKALHVARGD